MIPITYNVRNLAVRKTTTVATALGIALVVFVFAGVADAVERHREDARAQPADADMAIVLRKGADTELSSSIDEPERRARPRRPGRRAGRRRQAHRRRRGRWWSFCVEQDRHRRLQQRQVRGVPDNALAFRPEVKIVEGRAPQPGTDEVIVGRADPRPVQGARDRPDLRAQEEPPGQGGRRLRRRRLVVRVRGLGRPRHRAHRLRPRGLRLVGPRAARVARASSTAFKACDRGRTGSSASRRARDRLLREAVARARAMFLNVMGVHDRVLLRGRRDDRRDDHDVRARSPTASARSARCARSASRAAASSTSFLFESLLLALLGGASARSRRSCSAW